MWNCLWGHALKRSPGINRKSRVSYPGPGFLSSATWPSLPKKHYNGLINQPTTMKAQLNRASGRCQGNENREIIFNVNSTISWLYLQLIILCML